MRSLRNFFKSPVLAEALAVGRGQWLTVEDLVSFDVAGVPVFLRMDLAYRDPAGRVVIVDWKTGRGEGRFSEVQLAGYALYASEQGWAKSPEEIQTELAYLAIPRYVRRSGGPAEGGPPPRASSRRARAPCAACSWTPWPTWAGSRTSPWWTGRRCAAAATSAGSASPGPRTSSPPPRPRRRRPDLPPIRHFLPPGLETLTSPC